MEEITKTTSENTVPWDQRRRIGFFKALGQTVKLLLTRPEIVFARVKTHQDLGEHLLFYLTIQLLTVLSMTILQVLFRPLESYVGFVIMFIFIVPIIIVSLFAISGFAHIFVRLLGGQGGYKATYGVMAFSSVTAIFQVIPLAGILISMVWGIYLGVLGLKKVHALSTVRACIVFTMPTVVVLGFLFAVFYVPKHKYLEDNDKKALQIVRRISNVLERYAASHDKKYPVNPDWIVGMPPRIEENYCGQNRNGFLIHCDLKEDGYLITATPVMVGKTGSTTFSVKTGGLLSPPRPGKKIPGSR